MAKLSEICAINMGQSPESSSYNQDGDGLPFFQGNADFGVIHPSVRVWCNKPTKIARSGDVLFSVRAPIGAMNIADRTCCIGRGLASLTVDECLCYKQYFWHALASKTEELISQGTGSTFKAINKAVLADTEIPLPPMEKQKQIAAVLDKVSTLISLRKQQLAKLDELVKARFVEMFGDLMVNPYGFKKKSLKDTCTIVTGNTPPRAVPENYGDYLEWIKTDNIVVGRLFPTQAIEYLSEKGANEGRIVDKNAILMVCIAGSIASIGRVCITDRKVSFNQQINAIIPSKYDVLFLYLLLQLAKNYLVGEINMALKGILSKSKLEEKEFIIPPMKQQKEFAAFFANIEKTKDVIRRSLVNFETLKNSLMQEYFG